MWVSIPGIDCTAVETRLVEREKALPWDACLDFYEEGVMQLTVYLTLSEVFALADQLETLELEVGDRGQTPTSVETAEVGDD